VSAGEASGDHYGAEIIAGLRSRLPGATFTGLGGRAMEAAGQDRVVRAEDVAHMGLTEVIRHAPYIYAQYRKLVASIRRELPDVAVLIDFPDVNFRLAKHLRTAGVPVLWFVSPQLWAWKRRRLRWVQQRVDRMMVIFPFEEGFYKARGVEAEFVGHPLAGLEMPTLSREEYAAKYEIDPAKQWVALLPGSRQKELRANLLPMVGLVVAAATPDPMDVGEIFGRYGSSASVLEFDRYEFILPVASTISSDSVQQMASQMARRWARGSQSTSEDLHLTLVDDAREAMYFARTSVVASGTATVQALTIGNPFVVVYRVSKLSFAVLKRLVRYPKEIPAEVDEAGNLPVGMVNLIAGKRIVPELLNERFTAENLAAALRPLLEDGPERARMMAELAEARAKLVGEDPIGRVCSAVQELLGWG
jgi:lipid-A-disaccharide synthase